MKKPKPGTNGRKQETSEEFAARMGKEFRQEAARIKAEAEKKAKAMRKLASTFDGRRS